jgi:uncharacterized protein with PQ loop repeat
MSNAVYVIVHIVLPILGCGLALILSSSPLKTIIESDKKNELGSYNPLPSVAFFMTNVIWVIYGSMLKDVIVTIINCLMLIINLFIVSRSYKLCSASKRLEMDILILVYLTGILCFSLIFIYQEFSTTQIAFGNIAMLYNISIFFFPLMSMKQIIETKDSSSIFVPFAVVAIVNCTYWSFYGILMQNLPMTIPNAIGASLSLLQYFLTLYYPSNKSSSNLKENEYPSDMNL